MNLDAKVAELVPNGYCWLVEGYSALLKGKYIVNTFDDEVMADETSRSLALDEPKRVPRKFSTCPTACEDVKAEIRRRNWDLDVHARFLLGSGNLYVVFNASIDALNLEHMGEGRSLLNEYKAVCLAFVAAVGREEK